MIFNILSATMTFGIFPLRLPNHMYSGSRVRREPRLKDRSYCRILTFSFISNSDPDQHQVKTVYLDVGNFLGNGPLVNFEHSTVLADSKSKFKSRLQTDKVCVNL
jgi:hypothetical protein